MCQGQETVSVPLRRNIRYVLKTELVPSAETRVPKTKKLGKPRVPKLPCLMYIDDKILAFLSQPSRLQGSDESLFLGFFNL